MTIFFSWSEDAVMETFSDGCNDQYQDVMNEDEENSIDSTEDGSCPSVTGLGDIGSDEADAGSPRCVSQDARAKEDRSTNVAPTSTAVASPSKVQTVQPAIENLSDDAELVIAVGLEGPIDTQPPLMTVSQENHDRSFIGKEKSQNGTDGVAGHQARPLDPPQSCTSASLNSLRVTTDGGQNQEKDDMDDMDAEMMSSREPSSQSSMSDSPQRRTPPPMPSSSVGSCSAVSTPKSKNRIPSGLLVKCYQVFFFNMFRKSAHTA